MKLRHLRYPNRTLWTLFADFRVRCEMIENRVRGRDVPNGDVPEP